jgi:hypothetical protein
VEKPKPRKESVRKLVVSEFVSLDGVMQAPGGKDEDRDVVGLHYTRQR